MSTAYHKALELLHKATTPRGFTAAINPTDNYRRIWTRDSALCGLAALSTDDNSLKQTFKKSIETIFHHQHKDGFIPSNVSAETNEVSYGSAVGRVDNHAWIIISACTYAHVLNEKKWLQQFRQNIDACFSLMNAWEYNGRGLMYVPQSGDWADEYVHHGYTVYNQFLRLWALRCAAKAFEANGYCEKAEQIQSAIEKFFSGEEFYSAQAQRLWGNKKFPYWIAGFNASEIYQQFDLAANALSLLLKTGSREHQESVIMYSKNLLKGTGMLPCFFPAKKNTDAAMEELKNNYAFKFRNYPHQFHNGGLWPVWNGLMAFALGGYDAEFSKVLSDRIAAACSQNGWEFNECYNGETNEPEGVPHCAWSAAGLILSVNTKFVTSIIM